MKAVIASLLLLAPFNNQSLNIGGAPNVSNATGTLPIANGGTGSNTAAAARTALSVAKSGANTDITSMTGLTGALTTTGVITAGTAPTILTNASGTLKSASLDVTLSGSNTGDVTLAAVGSTPSANGASLSGQQLTLQPADGTHPGLIASSGAQTLGSTITLSQTFTAQGTVSLNSVSGSTTINGNGTIAGTLLASNSNLQVTNAATKIFNILADSNTAGVTAAGSTQTDCTNLTTDIADVSTVASGTGVCLPAALAGSRFYVHTSGANSLKVYMNAAGGGKFNALSSSTGVTIANVAGATPGAREFTCTSTTQCWSSATLPDTN